MAVTQKLMEGLEAFGFSGEKLTDLLQKMDKYINEIILFNSAYNLTNTSDYDEIVVNHILDSLSAVSEIKLLLNQCGTEQESVKIGDIGSGGGLPGIPLAAAMPEYKFVLVERMDKRCAFLENCAAILGLSNVSVMKKEAEKVPAESFDIATFRAFRPLDEKMTKTLLNLTKKGGYLAAYKAKFSSIQTEMDGIKTLVKDYSVRKLTVPFLTENSSEQNRERNLVVIQKC